MNVYVVMSMMCLETRNRQAIWRYSELDHTLFYTKKEIPKNTEVWICHWKNSPGAFYEGRVLGMKHDRAFLTTFGFGNLVFQVLHVVPVNPDDGKTDVDEHHSPVGRDSDPHPLPEGRGYELATQEVDHRRARLQHTGIEVQPYPVK